MRRKSSIFNDISVLMDQAKYGLRFESGEVLPKGGLADLSACVLYILKE